MMLPFKTSCVLLVNGIPNRMIQIYQRGQEHRESRDDWKYENHRKWSIRMNDHPNKDCYQIRPEYASKSVLSLAALPRRQT